MTQEIINKARELADAIVNSEEYRQMRHLEELAISDPHTVQAVEAYEYRRKAVLALMHSHDSEAFEKAKENLTQAKEHLEQIPLICQLNEARTNVDTTMENINRILHLVLRGETEDLQTGCSGNCNCCSQCGQTLQAANNLE